MSALPTDVERLARLGWRLYPASGRGKAACIKPNFRTLTVSAAAKPQNSAVLLDGDRIVVLKIAALLMGFSILTGSATVCWHSGLSRASRSTGRRESRFCRDLRAVTCSNSPYQPRKVWCLKNLRH